MLFLTTVRRIVLFERRCLTEKVYYLSKVRTEVRLHSKIFEMSSYDFIF